MKNFISLAIAALFSLSLFAQENKGVIWETGSFNDVLAKAQKSKSKKLIFIDCYTSWCGPCKKMANDVFPTEVAGKYFNANFINAKFDMEKGEGVELMKRYKVAAFPTFLILDANGNEVGRVVGSGELNEFIALVEKAKDVNNSPKKVREAYDNNKRMENAVKYFKVLSASYLNDDSKAFAEEVIDDFKPSDIFLEELWPYLKQNVNSSDKIHKYIVDHKNMASLKFGSENINTIVLQSYTNKLYYYLTNSGMYGKVKKEELTDDVIKSCITITKLIASSDDYLANTCARLAELRMAGKTADIVKMYNYNNFAHLNYMQIQPVERLFARMTEISKENIEEYYQQKAEFLNNLVNGVDRWKDMFVKAKEKQNK